MDLNLHWAHDLRPYRFRIFELLEPSELADHALTDPMGSSKRLALKPNSVSLARYSWSYRVIKKA